MKLWLRQIFEPKRVLLEAIRDCGAEQITTLALRRATGMGIARTHILLAEMEDRDGTIGSEFFPGTAARGGHHLKRVFLTDLGRATVFIRERPHSARG